MATRCRERNRKRREDGEQGNGFQKKRGRSSMGCLIWG